LPNPARHRYYLYQFNRSTAVFRFKAWSQNLGHEKVLTTFISYGEVTCQRQGEIIRNLETTQNPALTNADEIAEAVYKKFRLSGINAKSSRLESDEEEK
jgi:hypothetical protein